MSEMDANLLKNILEGALVAASEPLSIKRFQSLFPGDTAPNVQDLQDALLEIKRDCEGRGFELIQVASGYRIQVRESVSEWVSRLWEEKPARYSRALMETLALVAYRQPITRGEIEEVRGVAVSTNIIKTLQEHGWIRTVGHKDVPGRPALYATTRFFLDYFNLKSLNALPSLSEVRDLSTISQELDNEIAARLGVSANETDDEESTESPSQTSFDAGEDRTEETDSQEVVPASSSV